MPPSSTASLPSFSTSSDPWSATSGTKAFPVSRKAPPIRSAWDDDDEEDLSSEEPTDNAILWQEAETKAPMPSIVFTSSSTSYAPAAVMQQQAVRILRRPGNVGSPSLAQSASTIDASNTLKDRQAAYEAARARIFGKEEASTAVTLPAANTEPQKESERPELHVRRGSQSGQESADQLVAAASEMTLDDEQILYPRRFEHSEPTSEEAPVSSIVRQPRGPTTQSSGGSIGFGSFAHPSMASELNGGSHGADAGPPSPKTSGERRGRGNKRRKGGRGRGN